MKNFIANFADILKDVILWLFGVVGLVCILIVGCVILLTIFVFDMTVLTILRAISDENSLVDAMYEELEVWGELLEAYFKPYFAKEEGL